MAFVNASMISLDDLPPVGWTSTWKLVDWSFLVICTPFSFAVAAQPSGTSTVKRQSAGPNSWTAAEALPAKARQAAQRCEDETATDQDWELG